MSYRALYRKYRPSTLEDVIGQDVVIKILKNSILNDMVGHAYLFSGPRGIGKTTIAKAFAKTVNCLKQKDGVSCETCENCKSINEEFNPDIIEIDAASNNGVDEIREIKNKINLVPNKLKYKVYIIDEVHMLSIGAFNALLKTLEEPPQHIIFILATTDPQKVPSTIISRCQCFEFHRISNEDILKRLKYICKEEKIKVNDDVLERIAELSDGGLRDAIGMLDKLIAYSSKDITLEDFEKVNGIVSSKEMETFINDLHDKNVKNIIKFIDDIYNNGKDLVFFTGDLLKTTKNKIINYYLTNSDDDIEFLLSLANLLNDIIKDAKTASNIKTILEIRFLSFINVINESKVEKPIVKEEIKESKEIKEEKIEEKVEEVKEEPVIEEKEKVNVQDKDLNKQIVNNCLATANKACKTSIESKWDSLNEYALDGEVGAAASFISDGTVCAASENEVIISFSYESMIERGFNIIDIVEKLFKKIYDKEFNIAFVTTDEWKTIKQEFIDNKNKGITYEYVPINKNKTENKPSSKKKSSITNQAIELFGDDVVSV